MKLPEFKKITQDKTSTPPWAKDMKETDFISYGPTFQMKTYLDLFDEYQYPCETTGDITYYVYDPIKHGASPNKTYPVLMWFHGLNNSFDGKNCIFCCGAEQYATTSYQEQMGGAYLIVPLANEERLEDGNITGSWDMLEDGQRALSWESVDENKRGLYVEVVKAIYDKVCEENSNNIGKRFVMGASNGGLMTWQMLKEYSDYFVGAIPISSGYIPSDEELERINQLGIQVLLTHAKRDEMAPFQECVAPRIEKLKKLDNIECFFPEWVYNGDGGVSSICYGFEMGQHCLINEIQANLMFDDGTPMTEEYPQGITGWIRGVVNGQEE